MNELNKVYLAMLEQWGSKVEDDASLAMVLDGEKYPIKVEGQQVYLPLDSVLDSKTTGKVFFHPACESIISRETEIFKVIRKLTSMHLLATFKKIPVVLFDIAEKKSNKSLRNDMVDVIDPLRGVKAAQRKEISGLFEEMRVEIGDNNVDNRFIHFQITKGGRSKITGEKIYYKTKPIFPFYTEMARRLNRSEGVPGNQKVDVNGYSISLKSLEIAVHLFRSIFPNIDTPESYEYEYCRVDAARLCSFCGCYVLVCEDINTIQNSFRSDFDKVGVYGLETGFFELMDNISEIYRQVPAMPYNSQNTTSENKTTQSQNSLIDSVVNTAAFTPISQRQPNQPITNQQNTQGDASNGFRNVVETSMQMGEVYQGFTFDPNSGFFVHSTISPAGIIVYRVTRQGNLVDRQHNLNQIPMFAQQQQPMYYAQPQLQQPMYNQQGMYVQQQPQQPIYNAPSVVNTSGQVDTFTTF